jgi:Uma2 family endonuclease
MSAPGVTAVSKPAYLAGIVEMLTDGEVRRLPNIAWEDYLALLEARGDGGGARISFADGVLEFMAPLYVHEGTKDFVLFLVGTLAEELGLDCESAGSTTLKRADLKRGAEPDTCFYVQNAARILGKETIELPEDPPPDIVFEVDVTSASTSKTETYALMGVPELWRLDRAGLTFFVLNEGHYDVAEASRAFPMLRPETVVEFLEMSRAEGRTRALRAFREWVRGNVGGGE